MSAPQPAADVNIARRLRWLFPAFILLTIAIYWPGLYGGFVLDDYPNVVDNTALRVTDGSAAAWRAAIWASPASDIRRPLATLTFALNYATTGAAPFPMKAFNLFVHLVNGALLFLLMRRLVALSDPAGKDGSRAYLLPALVAGAWLVHPINLTAVLYVVQRMESLANAFVLGALIVYVDARSRRFADGWPTNAALWIGVPLLTGIGVLAKESAVMVPAYALLIEVFVLRGASSDRDRRRSAAYFALFLAIPAIVGLAYLLPRYLAPEAYAARPFTLAMRLMTEPRVLMDYVGWTLVPLPTSFSLYRDDFVVSRALFDPWTTVPAMIGILALAGAAIFLRKRRPLVALGIGWFLVAHALTATFIPLELVYEHRNYFASGGLLLAAFDLLLPGTSAHTLRLVRGAIPCALIAIACFSTALRAREWSNPVRFATLEADRHPQSPRATYDLGRELLIQSGYNKDSPLLARAKAALEHAASVPRASILPDVALIQLASRSGENVDPAWWRDITTKLSAAIPTTEDLGALRSLTECSLNGSCKASDADLLQVYLAAVSNARPDPAALYSYAIFAHRRLHDTELAVRLARDAADRPPRDPQYRLNLVEFLIVLGRSEEARRELDELKRADRVGRFSSGIEAAERRLAGLPRGS